MGSSAAAGQQGQPQKMPGGGQSGPIMDYSMGGGGMALYGGPKQMPGGGMPNPINDMKQPGGQNIQFPMPGQGQGNFHKAVMPGQGGMRTYDLQPGDPGHPGMMPNQPNPGMFPKQPGGLIAAPPQQKPGGILDASMEGSFRPPVQNPGMQMPPSNVPENRKVGSFKGLSKGTMPSMKKHVQAGKMGKARKAFEAGGGTWTKDVHKRLKKKYS